MNSGLLLDMCLPDRVFTFFAASEWFSRGVTKGAEKAGQWVKSGSEKLRQHMEPQSEPSKIDPRVQKGAQRAREVTGGAVKITSQMSRYQRV